MLKLYDKDKVELQEVSEDELFDFVGVEVFDNLVTCSTQNPREKSPGFFFAVFSPSWPLHSKSAVPSPGRFLAATGPT